MKYYAVRKGRIPGVYNTWDECLKQVHGFKGAEYKKFESEAEALAFMKKIETGAIYKLTSLDEDTMVVYVDGSFNVKTAQVGYGIVSFTQAGKESIKGCADGDFSDHRNVAGEIIASTKAMELALDRNKKRLVIHYDYAGIRHWALKEWKANLELTQTYQRFAEEAMKRLSLEFVKVQAHSGDKYNDEADVLAKEGCGIQ